MNKKLLVLICFVFILSGCSGKTAIWLVPEGVNDQQLMKDDLLCKQDMQTNIQPSGQVISDARRRATYYNNCMKLKGYKKSVVPRKDHKNPEYRYNISHPM